MALTHVKSNQWKRSKDFYLMEERTEDIGQILNFEDLSFTPRRSKESKKVRGWHVSGTNKTDLATQKELNWKRVMSM